MSQKTNPSSLRISSKYKNFSSCWYSDYFYNEMIPYDLQIRSYIEAVLNQSLHSQAVIRVQNNYKRFFISLFLLDARGIRHSRDKMLRLPLLSLKNLSQHNTKIAATSKNSLFFCSSPGFVGEAPKNQKNVKVSLLQEKNLRSLKKIQKQKIEVPGSDNFEKNSILHTNFEANNNVNIWQTKVLPKTFFSIKNILQSSCTQKKRVYLTNYRDLGNIFESRYFLPQKGDVKNSKNLNLEFSKVKQNSFNLKSTDLISNAVSEKKQNKQQDISVFTNQKLDTVIRKPNQPKESLSFKLRDFLKQCSIQIEDSPKWELMKTFQVPTYHSSLENAINLKHSLNYDFTLPSDLQQNYSVRYSSQKLEHFTTIHPVRVIQDIQNAEFLAREIVYLLQKRAAFRQIQSHILRQVIKSDNIKGIRLSCSGRVGGRSKKAQKSKTQSIQWGESSLHVFSSKLDFASKSASTLFGKVGVKVWLCFK